MPPPERLQRLLAFEDLERLAASGNRDLAVELWAASTVETSDLADGMMRLQQVPAAAGGVFAPIVSDDTPILTSVALVDDSTPAESSLDPTAREAVDRALDAAWRDVGGVGVRPPLVLRLGLGKVVVTGCSLYAAVYLAALARFGRQEVAGCVVATGHPDIEPDRVGLKARAVATAAKDLRVDELIVLTPSADDASDGLGLRRFRDPAAMGRHAFRILPWHPEAEVTRVQVCCGHVALPPTWDGDPAARVIRLEDRISKHDALRAVAKFREVMATSSRIDLSVHGPTTLAAALGAAARNQQADVRFVVAEGPVARAVWTNKQVSRVRAAAPASEARIVIGARSTLPDGWTAMDMGGPLTAADLAGCVDSILASHGATRDLHVAFATWLPLAWAVAGMLKNSGIRRYYQWVDGKYEPWLVNDRNGISVTG